MYSIEYMNFIHNYSCKVISLAYLDLELCTDKSYTHKTHFTPYLHFIYSLPQTHTHKKKIGQGDVNVKAIWGILKGNFLIFKGTF